jgi:hypothetical protein
VTICVLDGSSDAARSEFIEHCDVALSSSSVAAARPVVVADPEASVRSLAANVANNPLASVALAQLLRQRAYASVPSGLVAESLTYSMLQSGPEFSCWMSSRGPSEVPLEDSDPVLVDRAGGTLLITLNRPERANAFTAAVRDGLVDALRVGAADPSIDHVELRGAGHSFSSGGDLAEFGSFGDPATAHAVRLTRSPAWWLDRISTATSAYLHGACVGGGIEVAAFAGTVVAAPDTEIRLPEVSMGLIPGAGGTVSLPRRIGRHRTTYLALSGGHLDVDTALAWGLVDRIESD